jgi:hypothetical protein
MALNISKTFSRDYIDDTTRGMVLQHLCYELSHQSLISNVGNSCFCSPKFLARSASYLMGTRNSFNVVKWLGHEADHSPHLVLRLYSYGTTCPIPHISHGTYMYKSFSSLVYVLMPVTGSQGQTKIWSRRPEHFTVSYVYVRLALEINMLIKLLTVVSITSQSWGKNWRYGFDTNRVNSIM